MPGLTRTRARATTARKRSGRMEPSESFDTSDGHSDKSRHVWEILRLSDLVRKTIALLRCQHVAGVVVEFRPQLRLGHRILGRAAVELLNLGEHPAILERHPDRALEAARPGKLSVHVVVDRAGQRQNLRIQSILVLVGIATKPSAMKSLSQRVLEAHAAMRLRCWRTLLLDRLTHDRHVELGNGAFDARDSRRLEALIPETKNRRDVGMQHVRSGKRLEGGVTALPMSSEPVGDPLEALGGRDILKVR